MSLMMSTRVPSMHFSATIPDVALSLAPYGVAWTTHPTLPDAPDALVLHALLAPWSKSDIPDEVRPIVPTPPRCRLLLRLLNLCLERGFPNPTPILSFAWKQALVLHCREGGWRVYLSRASSDGPDAFSTLSMPASLEYSIRRAQGPGVLLAARGGPSTADLELATDALYRFCYALALDTTPSPHRLVAFPHTVALQQCTAVIARRLRLPYILAPPSPPPACAVRAMVVPHRLRRFYRVLARQVRLQQIVLSPIHARRAHHQHGTYHPPECAPHRPRRGYHLPARRHRVQHLTILRSNPAPVRHRKYDGQHRRSAQQVQRAFPSSMPPSSPPRPAPASSAPTPVAATNLGLLRNANTTGTIPRGAQHTLQLSPSPHTLPASHHAARQLPIASACYYIYRDDTAAGWQRTDHTEAMCTPRFHRYPHSTLGISDKRGWGTGATNPGGDNGTYAAPGFRIAPVAGASVRLSVVNRCPLTGSDFLDLGSTFAQFKGATLCSMGRG
ncbi:hypothetical protein B0H14DRAFT_3867595 [Mycena olivaceomarginata]|nr:hypothetical protein B0H14DRAFT_3867595 [Mycena olivaceomarginata]